MNQLGILNEITDLREIWPHEALNFTPWLADDDNISLLSAAIGIDISIDETESSVGNFNVDILATEVNTGRKIIIENQLEETNHDHLGKLITYASGKNADIIIWIVKHAREEHRCAIEWLNNHTDEDIYFFLCEIHLYKIGNSSPAPKFEVIEKPNDWSKSIKKADNLKPSNQFRLDYWTSFNDYAFKNAAYSKAFNKRKASSNHWMTLPMGSSAYALSVSLIKKNNTLAIDLYISEDKNLFKSLYEKKAQIESELGFNLDWCEMSDKKASRIIAEKYVDFDDRDQWPQQFDWIMETTLKMKQVFKKHIIHI